MKISIIGATGRVVTFLTMEALNRGHQVTAIARRTEKFSTKESLKMVSANVNDIDELAGILAGHDAVVRTFNPSPIN